MRVNFREIVDRFAHIDGEIVCVESSLRHDGGPSSARVVLRFYPWWEHPLYREAIAAGTPWGFTSTDEGARDVTITAISPLRCDLRAVASATDIAFHCDHPTLWEFEDEAEVFCNSAFDPRQLLRALDDDGPPGVTTRHLLDYLDPLPRAPPFSLGRLPRTLFDHVTRHLQRMGVELFLPRAPVARPGLVLFAADDSIAIVARDFEVELPEFEHRPEWFAPR